MKKNCQLKKLDHSTPVLVTHCQASCFSLYKPKRSKHLVLSGNHFSQRFLLARSQLQAASKVERSFSNLSNLRKWMHPSLSEQNQKLNHGRNCLSVTLVFWVGWAGCSKEQVDSKVVGFVPTNAAKSMKETQGNEKLAKKNFRRRLGLAKK